jgi:hypothetical protein
VSGIALGLLLWGGYVRHWAWTGFGANNTLWDWLELALLPTAVATLPLWLRHRPLIHPRGRRLLTAAATTFVALVLAGYLVPLAWTGFRGNTLWDWVNLLALPVTLVFLGPWAEVAGRLREHPRRHVLALAAAAFVSLAVTGYVIPMLWTGFPGNTLWDWLHLLLLPVLVPTVLAPALLRWIAIEESEQSGASAQARAKAPAPGTAPRAGRIAMTAAVALAAGAAGVALGAAALAGPSGATPRGPCDRPDARTLAAADAARVVRAGTGLYACRPGARPIRVASSTGTARPTQLRLAASRVVYAQQTCPRGATAGCRVTVNVLRLSDGRRFARARFAQSGPVTGLDVSPRGALAVMLGARCRSAAACGSGRLVLIDARGTRTVDSGAALDTASLAGSGTTVFWRHAGRATSTQLSG